MILSEWTDDHGQEYRILSLTNFDQMAIPGTNQAPMNHDQQSWEQRRASVGSQKHIVLKRTGMHDHIESYTQMLTRVSSTVPQRCTIWMPVSQRQGKVTEVLSYCGRLLNHKGWSTIFIKQM